MTLDDPAGGLPWVLERFDADRVVVNQPTRSLAKAKRIGRSRCVQLGRLRGATVGWIYGDGQFRRAGTEYPLLQCTALKRQAAGGRAGVDRSAVADPAAPASPARSSGATSRGRRGRDGVRRGSADGAAKVNDGAFLRVGGADARPDAASVQRRRARPLRLGAREGSRPRSRGASRSRR